MSKRIVALLYTCILALLVSQLALGAEVRKLGANDLQYSDTVSPAGKSVLGIQPIDVRAHGTALTDASITSAITAIDNGSVLLIPDNTYVFSSTVTVNKPITILLMGTKITGPASGYVFNVTVNDVSIIGYSDAKITLSTGGAGGIWNNQSMRTRYRDFKIDMNSVQNAIGFYHDGGWYVNVENLEIEKAKTHSTSDGIYILGTNTGAPGSNGTYGGSYVNVYKNIVARTVKLIGAWNQKVTTNTFINLDAETLTATNALATTLIQPVMQIDSGGSFFVLDNVAGFTAIGGDFEGTGTTVYTLTESVRGINSINNQISGVGNIYISGNVSDSGYFMDDNTPDGPTGFFRGYSGALRNVVFKNSNYTEHGKIGQNWVGNEFNISNNLTKTDVNTANLDNEAVAGTIISLDTSGRIKLQQATAGTNPVTLDNVAQFDNGGAIISIPYEYDNNAAAIGGGLTVGRLYRTGDALKIVH
jgi:hypothetical protein